MRSSCDLNCTHKGAVSDSLKHRLALEVERQPADRVWEAERDDRDLGWPRCSQAEAGMRESVNRRRLDGENIVAGEQSLILG